MGRKVEEKKKKKKEGEEKVSFFRLRPLGTRATSLKKQPFSLSLSLPLSLTFVNPASSSPSLIAPTLPSIMSDGATQSAPALA